MWVTRKDYGISSTLNASNNDHNGSMKSAFNELGYGTRVVVVAAKAFPKYFWGMLACWQSLAG